MLQARLSEHRIQPRTSAGILADVLSLHADHLTRIQTAYRLEPFLLAMQNHQFDAISSVFMQLFVPHFFVLDSSFLLSYLSCLHSTHARIRH